MTLPAAFRFRSGMTFAEARRRELEVVATCGPCRVSYDMVRRDGWMLAGLSGDIGKQWLAGDQLLCHRCGWPLESVYVALPDIPGTTQRMVILERWTLDDPAVRARALAVD